jgi:hypothetical protein
LRILADYQASTLLIINNFKGIKSAEEIQVAYLMDRFDWYLAANFHYESFFNSIFYKDSGFVSFSLHAAPTNYFLDDNQIYFDRFVSILFYIYLQTAL